MASYLNEFKRSKDSNRRTSLMLPGMKCPRPFSALDTSNFRAGSTPRSRPLFLIITAASDACEFWSPTSSRFDKVPALLRHRALCARVAPLLHRYPTHEAHSGSRPFSVKERTPMPFRNLTMDYPLAGRVMSAVYPPSCGASIGGVPRFMGVR